MVDDLNNCNELNIVAHLFKRGYIIILNMQLDVLNGFRYHEGQ